MPRTTARNRTRVLMGLAAGVLAGALAACGGGGPGGSGVKRPEASGRPGVTRVDVTMVDFRLTLSKTTFTAGHYDFVARNSGQHEHALEIEGPDGERRTRTLEPGESGNLDVALKPGTYEVYCPVDGHKNLGMKTEITVAVGAASPSESTKGGGGY